jgi:quinol-cytochrome oxidoreductase complex cytochrome b subunit
MRWNKNFLLNIFNNHLIDYPTPININYLYSFGSLAGIMLVIQILTGIFLAMHYTSHINLAFNSIEHIMRNINNGWLIRYIHSNGASFFFIVVYIHIFKGLYYGSYITPKELLWCSGVIIFILMMAIAFMGYVLPWGQMSFWGATVITNLFSAIPFIGNDIVNWLWGGFSIGNPTLNRFFSLHFTLPFILCGVILIHLILLHKKGSNNPLGLISKTENISFYYYFYVKDLFSLIFLLFIFFFIIFYYPNILGHPDNYIEANSLKTPLHIVPEWYFLPFYAILRSIPNKIMGVFMMFFSLIVLLIIPFINNYEIKSSSFRPFFKIFYWLFIINFILLGWIGKMPVEFPYTYLGFINMLYYFFFFLIIIPFFSLLENFLIRYKKLI